MTPETSFEKGCAALLSDSRVRALVALAGTNDLHLVGGCVRDAALGRELVDLDLVVARDGDRLAESYATATSARLVRLGQERFAAIRLVQAPGWIDLWDLQGGAIEADLWRRDLTINAIALQASSGAVLDPTGGRPDLERRLLRATRSAVFAEDPLRVLRLARFALSLPGFTIEPATEKAASGSVTALDSVATERVRDELEKLLGGADFAAAARRLDGLGVLPWLLPGASRLRIRQEATLPAVSAPLWPTTEADDPAERLAYHWALLALFAGSDLEPMRAALDQLRRRGLLSRTAYARAAKMLEPGWTVPVDEMGARRWLHEAGSDWRGAIALRIAGSASDSGAAGWSDFGRWANALPNSERREILAPIPLLSGTDVQRLLGTGPGPEVGESLAKLKIAQATGRVRTRLEAEELIRSRNPA